MTTARVNVRWLAPRLRAVSSAIPSPVSMFIINISDYGGTPNNIAAKVSYLTEAICLVVELDGKITIYSKGKIAFRIMG